MSANRVPRASRAAMFAAVCVVLAAVGHVLMSGTPLPWSVLVLAVMGTGLLGWVFAAQERRRRTVIALTLTVQACLHVAFSFSQTLNQTTVSGMTGESGPEQWARLLMCGESTPAAAARAYELAVETGLARQLHMLTGHGGATTHDTAGMQSMAGMHHMSDMSSAASWGMLAAHLLAALLCGVWLALGEQAAFRVLRAVADRAFVPLRLILALCPAADRAPGPFRRANTAVPGLRSRLLVHTHATRGPPGALAVA